jgi:Rrf2 family nitric oxide-sensitive transcriptional repressor
VKKARHHGLFAAGLTVGNEAMRLTKQTGHAIRILIDCAVGGDQLLKVADISARLGVTKQNVFKIVHILSHAGYISAVRGPSGGVRLARPASSIRVGDVVRAIEVTRFQVEGGQKTGTRAAPLNAMFDDALTAFIAVLDQHTVAELAEMRRLPTEAALAQEARPSEDRDSQTKSKAPATRSSRRS